MVRQEGEGPVLPGGPSPQGADRKGGEGGPSPGASDGVRVRIRGDGLLEVRLSRVTPADLKAIRSIPGRRWEPAGRAWVLPDTTATRERLKAAFGNRLGVAGERPPEPPDSGGGATAGATSQTAASRDAAPASAAEPADRRHYLREADRVVAELRHAIRVREYSPRTERAYVSWVQRFLRHHSRSVATPRALVEAHARSFLEHLAVKERLSAKSRNQGASALAFMFREVLGRDEMTAVPRAKGPKRVPKVLSHREALLVIRQLEGKYSLIASLLYSAGLRIEECLSIRLKDIDFELRQILVRDGKGKKDRYVPLADRVRDRLKAQIRRVAELHRNDRAAGHGWAPLPAALDRKDPRAGYELPWQYVFPARTIGRDPATGRMGRAGLHASAVQRAVKRAVRSSGITKTASCHTFRHSFATEALRCGCDIRTLQHVMGHKDIRTTMIYLHVIEQTGFSIRSPLDRPYEDPVDEAWHEEVNAWSERAGGERGGPSTPWD